MADHYVTPIHLINSALSLFYDPLTDNALTNSHMFSVRFAVYGWIFLSVKRASARQKTMTSSEITCCVHKVHNGILLYYKIKNLTPLFTILVSF